MGHRWLIPTYIGEKAIGTGANDNYDLHKFVLATSVICCSYSTTKTDPSRVWTS